MIEFDYAFAAETLGDPNRNISMMIATDSIKGPIFAVVARTEGGQDDYVLCTQDTSPDALHAHKFLVHACFHTRTLVCVAQGLKIEDLC